MTVYITSLHYLLEGNQIETDIFLHFFPHFQQFNSFIVQVNVITSAQIYVDYLKLYITPLTIHLGLCDGNVEILYCFSI